MKFKNYKKDLISVGIKSFFLLKNYKLILDIKRPTNIQFLGLIL